jgi:hypothetical protein
MCLGLLHAQTQILGIVVMKCAPDTYLINKFHRFFLLYTTDGTNLLVIEEDTIEFVGRYKHLRSKRCRDELAG